MAYMRHPDRVAFVLFGDAKLFSDTAGMCVYWPTNEFGPDSHRTQLRDLLGGGMQCAINASNDWMTSGDFDAVIRGLSGVSPLDPFRSTVAGPAPTAAPTPPPTSMADDEAALHLEKWMARVADDGQSGRGELKPILEPTEIARQAGVPEAKVALLTTVAQAHPHYGVRARVLTGGKYVLEIGPARPFITQ